MADQETQYGALRLKSKEARAAIVQKLGTDFNLAPIIAETYYQQVSHYFEEHANVTLSSGEIAYEAVAADEPAGKHIRLTRSTSKDTPLPTSSRKPTTPKPVSNDTSPTSYRSPPSTDRTSLPVRSDSSHRNPTDSSGNTSNSMTPIRNRTTNVSSI